MQMNRKRAFTLVEIMVVILIISLLLMIAIPQFVTARSAAQQKTCIANLKEIEYGKELFAINQKLTDGDPVGMADLWPAYIRSPGQPQCPGGGAYSINVIGTKPTCTKNGGSNPHSLP